MNTANASLEAPTAEPIPADAPRDPWLVALGERVRTLRERKGLTRKMFATVSRVSERHLANLELGLGNPSVLVLRQVALALGARLADLLGDETQFLPDARARRIALVGLRGAGKSTLGQKLADSLGAPFVELNREIERVAGCGVAEIHNLLGQAAYRRYERRALEEVVQSHPDAVIATPGGIVSDPVTYKLLLAHCYTVWLQAAPEEHMRRVMAQGDLRPMSGNSEAMKDLRRILDERAAYYSRADLSFSTSGLSLDEASAKLLGTLRTATGR